MTVRFFNERRSVRKMLAILCWLGVGSWVPVESAMPLMTPTTNPTTHPVEKRVDDLHVDLRSFGLQFDGPAGWLRAPELNYGSLARFIKIIDRKLVGLVEVESAPARGRTARAVADKLAADRSGSVVGVVATPLSADAVEVSTGTSAGLPAGATLIVPLRDQFVLISSSAGDAATATGLVNAVAKNLVSSSPKRPAEDLGLRKRPVSLFESAVLVTLPEPYRPTPVKDAKIEAFWGARNQITGKDEASIQFQIVPNPQKVPLAKLVDTMAKTTTEKLGLSTPVTYSRVSESPDAFLSTPFSTEPNETERVLQIDLGDGRLAVMIFNATTTDDADRQQYAAMPEAVGHSLRISAAYKQAHDDTKKAAEAAK